MATVAATYTATRAPAKTPISAHPAFPAIVALWFAALLGLGSLVLPVAVLERLVTVTGIASLVPSAAPPLGFTARVAIALSGAITGALLGLLLARQVARAHAPAPTMRRFGHDDAQPRRPISAHDELGEEGLETSPADQPLLAKKRRALAMAEESQLSTYLAAIPLPGQSAEQPLDIAPAAEPVTEIAEHASPAPESEAEPLELGEFADEIEQADEPAPPEPDPALEMLRGRIHTPGDLAPRQDQPMTDDRPSFAEPADEREEPFVAAAPLARKANSDAADPLPFAAPSLRRAEPVSFDAFDDEEEDDSEMAEQEVEPIFEAAAVQLSVIDNTAEPEDIADDRPLDELGLVQLAARLGSSLEKRRARVAAAPLAPALPAAPPLAGVEDFEVAEADDAARAIADFFGPAADNAPADEAEDDSDSFDLSDAGEEPAAALRVPSGLRALSMDFDDADDEEALEASLSLPLTKSAGPVPVFDADEFEDEAEQPADEDGDYSSLLAMKNPFVREQEFVRIDEPEDETDMVEPAVTFPSAPPPQPAVADVGDEDSAPRPFDPPKNATESVIPGPMGQRRDPGDAERSLRDALATLQRMSGAA